MHEVMLIFTREAEEYMISKTRLVMYNFKECFVAFTDCMWQYYEYYKSTH